MGESFLGAVSNFQPKGFNLLGPYQNKKVSTCKEPAAYYCICKAGDFRIHGTFMPAVCIIKDQCFMSVYHTCFMGKVMSGFKSTFVYATCY